MADDIHLFLTDERSRISTRMKTSQKHRSYLKHCWVPSLTFPPSLPPTPTRVHYPTVTQQQHQHNNGNDPQSMLGLFMRPGSLLFEVFPHKYYKPCYAPMAVGLGLRHDFSMSRSLRWFVGYGHPTGETCMKWYLCRWYARNSDVELDDEGLEHLVGLALVPAS